MVKFTHISNYSDLMGFTIFKCGSGYKNGLSDAREAVLFLIIPEMFPVSDRIPMTRRNLSRSPLCRIFVRRRFYPGLCLFLFLPPFSTGTALRRPYAVLILLKPSLLWQPVMSGRDVVRTVPSITETLDAARTYMRIVALAIFL